MRMRAMMVVETGGWKTHGVLYEMTEQTEQDPIMYHILCRLTSKRRRPRRMFPHSRGRSWHG